MYLVIQSVISVIVLIIIYAHCLFCTCSFPLYTHTHYGRVLTTLGLHVQLLDDVSLCRCSMSWYTLRGVRHSLPLFILVPLFLLYSCYSMTLSVLHSAAIFFLSFILLSCEVFMSYCSDFYGWDYSLFRLQFRLNAYTWGISLAYMRRHNVSVSLGSGRYKSEQVGVFEI